MVYIEGEPRLWKGSTFVLGAYVTDVERLSFKLWLCITSDRQLEG